MIRKLDLIWTCLFLFGSCTVSTYKPQLNLEIVEVNKDRIEDNETSDD